MDMNWSLDVCVFAHNSRRGIFQRVLESLARQTLSKSEFTVWIVDNASVPPLDAAELCVLERAGVRFQLLHEPQLGLVYARRRAIHATSGPWLVFVDDDNELADDYLANAKRIAAENSEFGCFGGKLILPAEIPAPTWVKPMLPFLAIKDCGDEPISKCADQWGNWEPPGAGAVVRRTLLDLYLKRLDTIKECGRLDRKGKSGLLSSGDSLIMRGCHDLKLQCSYQPSLRLWHHLDPGRFRFRYLFRLLFNYGRSYVLLERALGKEIAPERFKKAVSLAKKIPRTREKACLLAWQWGYYVESRNPSA
jgi:glycosyltransferase involved in cell wall biosynthesis